LKILRSYLEKKDNEITDLNQRLERRKSEMITFSEHSKQIGVLRKQNDEQREQLKAAESQVAYLKQLNEHVLTHHAQISEELKPKKELTLLLKGLLEKQEFTDCILVNNNQRYPAHKCILAVRSEALRRLLEGGPLVGHNTSILSNDTSTSSLTSTRSVKNHGKPKKEKEEPVLTPRSKVCSF
jgi:hypothetical protein